MPEVTVTGKAKEGLKTFAGAVGVPTPAGGSHQWVAVRVDFNPQIGGLFHLVVTPHATGYGENYAASVYEVDHSGLPPELRE